MANLISAQNITGTYTVPRILSHSVQETPKDKLIRKLWTLETEDGTIQIYDFSKTDIIRRCIGSGGTIVFAPYLTEIQGLTLHNRSRSSRNGRILRTDSRDPNFVARVHFVNHQHRNMGPTWVYCDGVQIA